MAPPLRVRPGVSYRDAVCQTCGASSGDPCVGLRYDQVHPSRFREIESAHQAASSAPSPASAPPYVYSDALAAMEEIVHLLGLLGGLQDAQRIPRLRRYLVDVQFGRADTPIGLNLSIGEVDQFLQAIEPVMEVAIRLRNLALSREAPPDEKVDES